METSDPRSTDARRLTGLMDERAITSLGWQPKELAPMAAHQLNTALKLDLCGVAPDITWKLRMLTSSGGRPIETYRDLFDHPQPPLELLQLVKRYAKAAPDDAASPLPQEIAALLYFTSIAAARVRCGQNITTLDGKTLREGMQWLLDQPWVVGSTSDLLRQCIELLAGDSEQMPEP